MSGPGHQAPQQRPVWSALRRGAAGRCPRCGRGSLFDGFLKVVDVCACCGEFLHYHRADDAPPYFNMLIVGHIVVGLVLWSEIRYAPPMWVHAALWFPLSLVLAVGLMRPIKGFIVGWQWVMRMHGFDPDLCDDETPAAGWKDGR